MGSLTNLEQLQLQHNAINGTLPPEWSNMTNIKNLYLYNYYISGSLPASWAVLPYLVEIQLYQNNLTGTLPKSWNVLPLQYLLLGANYLTRHPSRCMEQPHSTYHIRPLFESPHRHCAGIVAHRAIAGAARFTEQLSYWCDAFFHPDEPTPAAAECNQRLQH